MKVHFIAVGGSAMHNIACALDAKGWIITGSDDEIYEPSLSRLRAAGICPESFGWFPDKITSEIDIVVLGMHARKDNPELLKAQILGLKIMSYPEFLYHQSIDKKRVVIAGSHGKTTTTSIVIHVLKYSGIDCDYMVGAQLEGFDRMVNLSHSNLIILEGDEYLSSPIDLRSKISHYHPHITAITGVSWDHINVFPAEQDYINRFVDFIDSHDSNATLIYYEKDKHLRAKMEKSPPKCALVPYDTFVIDANQYVSVNNKKYPFKLIGDHNLQNARAAYEICKLLDVTDEQFFDGLQSFKGAAKRLQKIFENEDTIAFLDFAHAPSKVNAATKAVKQWFPQRQLLAVLELHTFSSLNKNFLPQYIDTMEAADVAVVFYDQHTLEMKKMSPLDAVEVKTFFNHPNIQVFEDKEAFHKYLDGLNFDNTAMLLMSSGTFGGYDLNKLNKW